MEKIKNFVSTWQGEVSETQEELKLWMKLLLLSSAITSIFAVLTYFRRK